MENLCDSLIKQVYGNCFFTSQPFHLQQYFLRVLYFWIAGKKTCLVWTRYSCVIPLLKMCFNFFQILIRHFFYKCFSSYPNFDCRKIILLDLHFKALYTMNLELTMNTCLLKLFASATAKAKHWILTLRQTENNCLGIWHCPQLFSYKWIKIGSLCYAISESKVNLWDCGCFNKANLH